jgi:hypothetical protein
MKILSLLALTCVLFSSASYARRGDKPICDGTEPPRRGAPFTELASYGLKIAAYQEAVARYELEHPEAADYAAVVTEHVGRSCFADDECSTGDARFLGSCQRYVWDGTNGSCIVTPQVTIPTPPAFPALSCEDVSCPSHFQCEVENNTGAVGCVEQRLCRPAK